MYPVADRAILAVLFYRDMNLKAATKIYYRLYY